MVLRQWGVLQGKLVLWNWVDIVIGHHKEINFLKADVSSVSSSSEQFDKGLTLLKTSALMHTESLVRL